MVKHFFTPTLAGRYTGFLRFSHRFLAIWPQNFWSRILSASRAHFRYLFVFSVIFGPYSHHRKSENYVENLGDFLAKFSLLLIIEQILDRSTPTLHGYHHGCLAGSYPRSLCIFGGIFGPRTPWNIRSTFDFWPQNMWIWSYVSHFSTCWANSWSVDFYSSYISSWVSGMAISGVFG
jgi:hypothetical protein